MTNTTDEFHATYQHYPREVAAQVTLGAAGAALTAAVPPGPGACVAITTACAALVTRLGLVEYLGVVADRAADAVVRPVDAPFALPERLYGRGAPPSAERLAEGGERCVAAWRRWATSAGTAADDPRGVAGALGLAAWCAWALGSTARARTRARYALDIDHTDPLAELVVRWCRNRQGPTWWPVSSTVG